MNNKSNWPWIVISIFITIISILYAINFHNHNLSDNPSDWGAIGDYFGGLINPLTSLVALYFLIQAYTTQKEELKETKDALKESAIHSKTAAHAQSELAEMQKKQLEQNEKSIKNGNLSSAIEFKYNELNFCYEEIERCTQAKNKNWYTFDANGRKLHTDFEMDNYRAQMYSKASKIRQEIETLIHEFQT